MTLILSMVTARYTVQISDRLVTQENQSNQYDPWDPASNKSVVLLGRDGLISMGYCGPAFISSSTTDGWIAETVVGYSMGANRDQPDFAFRHGEGVSRIGPLVLI